MEIDANVILNAAHQVLQTEIAGLQQIDREIGIDFIQLAQACMETLDRNGKLVVSGIGKSGHIGRKISATLASTGSPSIFMHPVEAMHGDLGMLQEGDLLIAISYSGATHELNGIILPAKRLGVPVACLTGNPESELARLSDIVVPCNVEREACPFNLAPTTSTTAQLALGDALAMTLIKLRQFTKEDYGLRHPAGAIGRAVTLRVGDLIRKAERIAVVTCGVQVKDVLLKMTEARSGSAVILDDNQRVLGIFTDGDLRRGVNDDLSILTRNVEDVMTHNPITVKANCLAVEMLKLIEKRHIDDVIVVNQDGRFFGMVDTQDLPSFKVM